VRTNCTRLQDTDILCKDYIVKSWQCIFWAQKGKIWKRRTVFDGKPILEITASCIPRKLSGLPPKLKILLAVQVQSCVMAVQVRFHWISFTE